MNKKQRNLIITIIIFAVIIVIGMAAYTRLSGSVDNVSNLSQADAGTNTAQTETSDASGADTDADAQTTSADETESTNIAPELAFTDMDGNLVNLSDYFDKPIVLNFWATTCPYCLKEIPEFDSVYANYKDDVHFIMLNVAGFNGETAQMGMDYVAENSYSLPFYFDTEGTVMYTFGLSSLPMTLFLKEGGAMEAYAQGQCDAATLEKGISMIME